jgi:hypothetical protein
LLCLIAGNAREAKQWAYGQMLDDNEWFFPLDFDDLKSRSNYHVLVVGTAGVNVPPEYFERLLHMAKSCGKVGRG